MRLFALAATSPWSSWRPASCLPDQCFCEALGDGLIRQPVNTWSSFAFVLAASWIVVRIRSGRSRGAALRPWEAALFAGTLVLIGLGSASYHASLTFAGQLLDLSGMYLVATFVLLHRLSRRWSLSPARGVLGFATLNLALLAIQVTAPVLRRGVFAVLLVAALVVEWRAIGPGKKWLGAGAGLMLVAFLIWTLDLLRVACDATSLLQGHALWHILGALAAACLFRAYEAEAS